MVKFNKVPTQRERGEGAHKRVPVVVGRAITIICSFNSKNERLNCWCIKLCFNLDKRLRFRARPELSTVLFSGQEPPARTWRLNEMALRSCSSARIGDLPREAAHCRGIAAAVSY